MRGTRRTRQWGTQARAKTETEATAKTAKHVGKTAEEEDADGENKKVIGEANTAMMDGNDEGGDA